jgi:hypothetical protein
LSSVSGTTLPRSGRWIQSTFISANIMKPQWFGVHLRLCHKIFQVHISLVQPQIVLSHLQVMHYGKELFPMTSLSPLTTVKLRAFLYNGHPFCINTPPMAKSLVPYTPQKVCQIPRTWTYAAKTACS